MGWRASRSNRGLLRPGATLLVACVVLSSCSTAGQNEERLARGLVERTEAAGVAPGLTVQTATALYGRDAPQVCDVYDDGLGSAAQHVVGGNPSLGRRKAVTQDAVTYLGLVVATYCPELSGDYREAVDGLAPVETTD